MRMLIAAGLALALLPAGEALSKTKDRQFWKVTENGKQFCMRVAVSDKKGTVRLRAAKVKTKRCDKKNAPSISGSRYSANSSDPAVALLGKLIDEVAPLDIKTRKNKKKKKQ